MVGGDHALADELAQLVVGVHAAGGGKLGGADLRQRRCGPEVTRHPHPGRQRIEIAHVGQVAGIDQRPVPRVAGGEPQPSPARYLDQFDQYRHRPAGRVGQALFPVGNREHLPLQVRCGQPRVAAGEPARLGHVGGQRPPVGEPPAG
jgi:hypothetical protein